MKKTLTIMITSVAFLILAFSITIMIIGSRAIRNTEPLYIFGYSFTVVAPTGSMIGDNPDSLDNYDIAIIRRGSYDEIEIGMVIVFQTEISSTSKVLVIHRVVGVHSSGGFETKGDNNPNVDPKPVTEENFQGIYVSKITFLRPIAELASSGKNVVFLILVVVLAALLVSELMNIVKQISKEKEARMIEASNEEIEKMKALETKRLYDEILAEEIQKKDEKIE